MLIRRSAWALALLVCAPALRAEEIPVGAVLDIRLQQSISSYASKKGTAVAGMLVSPVRHGDRILLPMGTKVYGVLGEVQRVGMGVLHETASVQIDFNKVELPGGRMAALKSRLLEVDNARESVDSKGRVRGIRSTGTIAHRAYSFVSSFAAFDPIALAFTMASMSSLLRFSEPEIMLPAGAEFLVRVEAPVTIEHTFRPTIPTVAATAKEREDLRSLIRKMPYQTEAMKTGAPSDLINVLFSGRRVALERAFAAAGWVRADTLSAGTAYRALRSWTENQAYQSAPMSTLLLDERKPEYAFSKTLNTFAKRHHVRIWARSESWDGDVLWSASSTQDIGITYKGRTHVIDQQIDNERAKVVNDLILTGCVDGLDLISRPWVPRNAQNATRERVITDGAIAVLRLNDCDQSHAQMETAAEMEPLHGGTAERVFRQSVLTFKNDVVRGNVIWRGVEGIHWLRTHSRPRPAPEDRPLREIEIEGDSFSVERASLARSPRLPEEFGFTAEAMVGSVKSTPAAGPVQGASRWTPPLVELGLSGGSLGYGTTLGGVGLSFMPKRANTPNGERILTNLLNPGWTFAPTVTLNAHRLFSHEWGFAYQSGTFHAVEETPLPGGATHPDRGLVTQQFSYNTLFHLRSRNSRLRPYFAAGPVFQMIRLTGNNMKGATGVFRFGLRDIGLIRAAYDFGSSPPQDGGGIFQAGIQYGGGIRYRVAPRWTLRADVRETMSPQPHFWTRATAPATSEVGEGTVSLVPEFTGKLRQQRFTVGFAFTF